MSRFTAGIAVLFVTAICPSVVSGQIGYPSKSPYGHDSSWTDPAPHRSYLVNVRGVNLNCLDFRGSGPPVILIHGLADSPHIFDDLAIRLKDRFHVVAYARRGHGGSDSPIAPYDDQTLVQDVRELLAELRFPHASLIGWGMGGDEITGFAAKYPEKVDKLVYIDAGYDYTASTFYRPFGKVMAVNVPPGAALRDIDSLRAWYQEAWVGTAPWTDALEASLRDVMQLDRMGIPHPVPNQQAFGAMVTTLSTWRRQYGSVKAPALSIYAAGYFPTERRDPALTQIMRDFETNTYAPFRRENIERIKKELKSVKVIEIPNTTHVSILTQNVDSLAAMITEFLGSQ